MNEKNLIPFTERTENEQREIASKGGKASGKSRKRKKSMKQCMEMLLALPASPDDCQLLSELGVAFAGLDADELNNMIVVNAALLKAAKSGDVSAVRELRNIIRDDERIKIERDRLKLEKERLEIEKKKYSDDNSDVLGRLDDVLSKIGE